MRHLKVALPEQVSKKRPANIYPARAPAGILAFRQEPGVGAIESQAHPNHLVFIPTTKEENEKWFVDFIGTTSR